MELALKADRASATNEYVIGIEKSILDDRPEPRHFAS
jgi:hypothetical protein